jgi:putative addiction module component (TIGR02574 family)
MEGAAAVVREARGNPSIPASLGLPCRAPFNQDYLPGDSSSPRFHPMASPKIDFSHLTPAERIELIEALWDSLEPDQAAPMTPELANELDRRSADAEANPHAGRTWKEIRAELEKRLE